MPTLGAYGPQASGSSEARVLSRLESLAASQARIESSLATASSTLASTTATLAAVAGDVSTAVAILEGRSGGGSEPDTEAGPAARIAAALVGGESPPWVSDWSGESRVGGPRRVTRLSVPRGSVSAGSVSAGSKRTSVCSSSPCIVWALPDGWPSTVALRDVFEGAIETPAFLNGSTIRPTSRTISSALRHEAAAQGGRRRLAALSPDSNLRLVAGLCSMLVLAYDACAVPFLLAWDIPIVGALRALAIGSTCFWTLDVLLNFVSGYHNSSGAAVTELRHVARRYLLTWFLPDLMVLVCDWLSIVLVANASDSSAQGVGAKVLRFTKAGRLLRVTGMLRMVKFAVAAEEEMETRLSDVHRFLLKAAAIFFAILWVTHLLACAFFAIGRSAPSSTGMHWVDNVQPVGDRSIVLLDEGLLYQYVVSLHWSIAQITLGSMEVCVTNTAERVFTIGMLLLGLIFGCTLISALSGTILELHLLTKEKEDTFRALRMYLRANRVGWDLAQLVQRQAAERFGRKMHLSSTSVRALNFISASLREELHFQICQPYIVRHPLLRFWAGADESMCRHFCFECVTFRFPMPGDDVFFPGAAADSCYHVVSGSLVYVQEPGSSQVAETKVTPVTEGRWLCEAALWSQWIHVGRLEAETECQLLAVEPQKLGEVLQRNRILRDITVEYAWRFHQRIVSAKPPAVPWPDDLGVPNTEYCDLVVSTSAGCRTYIGLSALEQHAAVSGWGWPRGLAGGPDLAKLRAEVQEGRSVVTVDGRGEIERIVAVVALRLTRGEDGRVLALLATQEAVGAAAVPCCQLPGKKQDHGTTEGDAFEGILRRIGLAEADVEVVDVQRGTEWRESKEYRVRTKYLRTECHAKLLGDFDMEAGFAAVAKMVSSMRSGFDVITRRDGDKTYFYAWLAPGELEQLQTSAGEAKVLHMLGGLGGKPRRQGSGGIHRLSFTSGASSVRRQNTEASCRRLSYSSTSGASSVFRQNTEASGRRLSYSSGATPPCSPKSEEGSRQDSKEACPPEADADASDSTDIRAYCQYV